MPLIADFGLMSIMKDPDTILDTHTSVGGIGTPRWSAPELLDPPTFGFKCCRPSKESDCYSFGMTVYEVRFVYYILRLASCSDSRQILTGKLPFHDIRTDAVIMRIVRGTRPERPHLSHAIGFTDPVWAIVVGCWKEHHSFRPDVPTVVRCLATAAEKWTPTPPLDSHFSTVDESDPFSMITPYDSTGDTRISGQPLQAFVIQ